MLQLNLIPKLLRSRSVSRLNEKRTMKKIERSERINKDLEQNKEKINRFNKRNISFPLKKDKEEVKDIHDLDEKFEKRFNKVDNKIDEMKTSMDSLFLLFILKEDIPNEKEKPKIRNYIESHYKKLLPSLFKEPPVNNNNEEDEKEISIQNQKNNNIQKKPAIKEEINIKNNNKNDSFQKLKNYSKNPFIDNSFNNNDNNKPKKKYSFRKKINQPKSNRSSIQNNISSGNSINYSIKSKSNTKSDNFNISISDNDKNIDKNNSNRNFSRNKKVEKQSKNNNINNNSLINRERKIENASNNRINQSSSKNTEKKNIIGNKLKKNINIKRPNKFGNKTFEFVQL